MVQERAVSAGLTLETVLPEGLPGLRVDEHMFKQMLINLLWNAVKFTPEGGRVCVRPSAAPMVRCWSRSPIPVSECRRGDSNRP